MGALGKISKKLSQKSLTVPKMSHSAHSLSLYNAEHTQLVSKTEELSAANQNRARKDPPTSSANQNWVLRHPSRQPIRIEVYVTRELSASVEVPSGLSARVGSLYPILKHRDLNPTPHPPPPPPSDVLTLLLLTSLCITIGRWVVKKE